MHNRDLICGEPETAVPSAMARGLRILQGGQPGGAIREAVTALLDESELLCLATSTGTAGPHIVTLYFAHDNFTIWFVSDPETEHSRQVQANPRVAAAVYLPCAYGEERRGLQMAGTVRPARPAEAPAGMAVYRARFPGDGGGQLFRFEVDSISLIDEVRFGPGTHKALVVR
jgi:uncharacterized protein YhbP (UPF0306 family)